MSEGTGHGNARMRRRLVIALVALQVLVAGAATAVHIPGPFGFHMFSRSMQLTVTAQDDAGHEIDLNLGDWVVEARVEIDWLSTLPRHVCQDTPKAATVIVRQGPAERKVRCD